MVSEEVSGYCRSVHRSHDFPDISCFNTDRKYDCIENNSCVNWCVIFATLPINHVARSKISVAMIDISQVSPKSPLLFFHAIPLLLWTPEVSAGISQEFKLTHECRLADFTVHFPDNPELVGSRYLCLTELV